MRVSFFGLKEFKNKNYIKAKFYFSELKPNFENQLVFAPLKLSLINWSEIMISNKASDIKLLQSMPNNLVALNLFKRFSLIVF